MMDLVQYGQTIVAQEIESIQQMKEKMDDNFATVVKAILKMKGKLIVCGIGKSADIGRKIVATLNSTGTTANFLHATDAIHGDLGVVKKEDVILLISKSGESNEIVYLIPILKKMGNTMIAMVGNLQSTLAKQADHILNTSINKEAGEHQLAPTSSTTCQLVMGDALAMCLMKCKNFSASDFAQFHPGGALGKKLLVTIKDIIHHNHNPFVGEQQGLNEVIISISRGRLGATAVLDQHNNLVGIITDGDIRRIFEKNIPTNTTAKTLMTKQPQTMQETELASTALACMNQKGINQLIVLNEKGAYKGIIHLHDILKEGIL